MREMQRFCKGAWWTGSPATQPCRLDGLRDATANFNSKIAKHFLRDLSSRHLARC